MYAFYLRKLPQAFSFVKKNDALYRVAFFSTRRGGGGSRKKAGSGGLVKTTNSAPPPATTNPWQEVVDKDSGEVYYCKLSRYFFCVSLKCGFLNHINFVY